MSGGVDELNFANIQDLTGKVEEVMKRFNVDEKTARDIIEYGLLIADEKMKKWTANMRKIQKQKAEEIYGLIKKLKKKGNIQESDMQIISDIEEKILKTVVEK